MYIENVKQLDKNCLLSTDVMAELLDVTDALERTSYIIKLGERAKELKCKGEFEKFAKTVESTIRKAEKAEKEKAKITPQYMTTFAGEQELNSGCWIAGDNGVYTMTDNGIVTACPHPIVPVGILVNAESGECKVVIKYKLRGQWRKVTVPRSLIASSNRIVSLADYGIQVTSENARELVKYLSDIEALNSAEIGEHISTSRMGWVNGKFVPYCGDEIIFDNEQSLHSLFSSVRTEGSFDKWLDCYKEIRAKKMPELLIYTASSYASALVELCGCLPFIVSLWGGTGKGKTVSLTMATAIWADPKEGRYMADAKATTTAMEIRLDALNSLPMCIDDMAQVQQKFDGDFSQLIYYWCQGKGRERSNQSLGLNKPTHWSNCTLTNGERSMVTESTQGGAVNRVIDVELQRQLFNQAEGNRVTRTLQKNFGFGGELFIQAIETIGKEEVYKLFEYNVAELKCQAKKIGVEKEDKQIAPMALILTADQLTEKYIYKDGILLDHKEMLNYMWDKGEIDENKRAYEYLTDRIIANVFRFNDNNPDYTGEIWGHRDEADGSKFVILTSALSKIIDEGGFQKRAFLSWAEKQGLILEADKGRHDHKFQINGIRQRCVTMQIGFIEPEEFELTEEDIKSLPFA